MEELDEKRRIRRERYLSDARDLEELITWALNKDRDEHEYWEPISVIQHRLPGVLPRIGELASSPDPRKRELAATVLGQNGASIKTAIEECLQMLHSILLTETNPDVVCAVLYAFGHLQDSRSLDVSLQYVENQNAEIRRAVVSALSGFEHQGALHALVRLSSDPSADVRNWATFGLGSLSDADTPEIRQALADRLNDEDDEVSDEAIAGLCERGDIRAVGPFLRVLEQYDPKYTIGRIFIQGVAESVVQRKDLGIEYLPLLERFRDLHLVESAVLEDALAKCQRSGSDHRRS